MKKKLLIDGMSCNHCVNHLNTALTEDIKGVEVIEISLENKYAIVDMNDDIDITKLKEVIEELDFEIKDIIEFIKIKTSKLMGVFIFIKKDFYWGKIEV